MDLAIVKKSQTFGSVMIVAGCCIGAGMIGLPVVSAASGFFPTMLVMLLCYLFSTTSGLLLLEATLWFDREVNLFSIVDQILGKYSKVITGVLFISLFYCISVAYMDGAGQMISHMMRSVLNVEVSREAGILLFVSCISLVVYTGTASVDYMNRFLMFLLGCVFLALVSFGVTNVEISNLSFMDYNASIATMPILLICFGFQNMVPTLVNYLKKDISSIRFAILIGNMIPFAIYTLWNFIILGLISHEDYVGISETVGQNDLVVGLLEAIHSNGQIIFYVKAFSMLAIITSFLPNCVSFIDFIKDGIQKNRSLKYETPILHAIVLLPPMLFSMIYPHLFLQMLGFAGGVVNVIIFGIMPVMVIFVGRYYKGIAAPYRVYGGKALLAAMLTLSLIFLVMSIKM